MPLTFTGTAENRPPVSGGRGAVWPSTSRQADDGERGGPHRQPHRRVKAQRLAVQREVQPVRRIHGQCGPAAPKERTII